MQSVHPSLVPLLHAVTDSTFVVTTGEGMIAMVSHGAEKILRLSASQLFYRPFFSVFSINQPPVLSVQPETDLDSANAFGAFVREIKEKQTGTIKLMYQSGNDPFMRLQGHLVELSREDGGHVQYLIHLQPAASEASNSQLTGYDTRHTKAEYQLSEHERRLRESEKLANVGSWETNLLTGEIYLSEQFFDIYEITEANDRLPFFINEKQGLQYVHPEERSYVANVIDTAFGQAQDFNFEHRIITRKGNVRYIHSACFFTHDKRGKGLKALGMIQDITERKHREAELMRARQQAEEAVSSKQQFLSVMSHEIRTPLNAVIGLTYLLLQEESLPEQLENLQMLRFSSENLLALVNDVLDLSKIEAGKIAFEAVDFQLLALIQHVCHSMQFKAEEKGVLLQVNLDAHLPDLLVGDPTRLTQILNNLVGNAIKFSEQGTVTIGAHVMKETAEHVTVHFSVADTGIGIAPDKIRHIFESFTQANADTTRKYGGTGLGLAITKRLLELQGSQIEVVSELNTGSTFSFGLAFGKPVSVPQTYSDNAVTATPLPSGVKILLVDDNEMNRLVASKFLNKWNIFPDVAANGQLALEQVQTQPYDLILMDLQMPVLNGYQATQAIRQLPAQRYRDLPIIALTADAVTDVREKAIAAGVNDILSKPFRPDDLYAIIQKYLRKQPVSAKVKNTTDPTATDNPLQENVLVRFDKITELAGNDADFHRQLTTLCISSLHEFRKVFRDALLKRNVAQADSVLHKMKQVLIMLEIQPLQEEIELAKTRLKNRRTPMNQLKLSISRIDQLGEQAIDALIQFQQ